MYVKVYALSMQRFVMYVADVDIMNYGKNKHIDTVRGTGCEKGGTALFNHKTMYQTKKYR